MIRLNKKYKKQEFINICASGNTEALDNYIKKENRKRRYIYFDTNKWIILRIVHNKGLINILKYILNHYIHAYNNYYVSDKIMEGICHMLKLINTKINRTNDI